MFNCFVTLSNIIQLSDFSHVPASPIGDIQVWCHEDYSKEMCQRRFCQNLPVAAVKCHRLDGFAVAVAPI